LQDVVLIDVTMKKSAIYPVLLIIAFVSVLSGCAKVEEDIIGEWKSELMLANPTKTMTWEFKTDGTLVRTLVEDGETITDNCFYSVEKKLTKTLIKIEGSSSIRDFSSDMNGFWQVEYFKDDIMKLRRVDLNPDTPEKENASYLYREFTRLN